MNIKHHNNNERNGLLMFFKPLPDEKYMADWPLHYFEISDVNVREACLKETLKEHPDSEEDKRRLALLQKRYGKKASKNRGDLFIRAFMMILISSNNEFHAFDIMAKEKELQDNLRQLAVLDEIYDDLLRAEWQDFARQYMKSCLNSPSYRSTLFGTVHLSDETVASKIAGEIDLVTRITPAAFHLEKECGTLHEIMKEVYLEFIPDGQQYWKED